MPQYCVKKIKLRRMLEICKGLQHIEYKNWCLQFDYLPIKRAQCLVENIWLIWKWNKFQNSVTESESDKLVDLKKVKMFDMTYWVNDVKYHTWLHTTIHVRTGFLQLEGHTRFWACGVHRGLQRWKTLCFAWESNGNHAFSNFSQPNDVK